MYHSVIQNGGKEHEDNPDDKTKFQFNIEGIDLDEDTIRKLLPTFLGLIQAEEKNNEEDDCKGE